MKTHATAVLLLATLLGAGGTTPAAAEPTALDLQKRDFFSGRDYFMVRSGRVQFVVQVDRADLGPAVTGYLLDADHVRQCRKKQAYNYTRQDCVRSSALEVVAYNGHVSRAYGQQTRARWTDVDGTPTVLAQWWADGVRVVEGFSGLANIGAIRRTIRLHAENIYGQESVTLRLRLPSGNGTKANRMLLVTHNRCPQALIVTGQQPLQIDAEASAVTIGPLVLTPGQTVEIDTYMMAQIPAGKHEDFIKQASLVVDPAKRKPLIDATRNRWAHCSRLETQDEVVRSLFANTRNALHASASDAGHMRAGVFMYGDEWVRDSSQLTMGLTASGHFELSRAVLEHILRDMITDEGTTIVSGGFTNPDREQFDQTGEMLYALRWYTDFTGDKSLVRNYRKRILALIERPLRPEFRDETGMVHNRREFWEQTMADAYELAYNTYVVVGLREAAKLAPLLGAEDRQEPWLLEADRIRKAMLTHPSRALVEDGRLIKRRNVTGAVAEHLVQMRGRRHTPVKTGRHHRVSPDATMALPIALGVVAPRVELACNTLDEVEKLWNMRWFGGGYDRYNSSSSINNPGPWPFATCFVLRAQHAAGQMARSRRSLEWLHRVEGGRSGSYYEEVPIIAEQQVWCGLVSWTTGEIPFFLVRHYLGVTFEDHAMVVRPALYPGSPPVAADLRLGNGRLRIEIDGPGPISTATLNGKGLPVRADGGVRLPQGTPSGQLVLKAK